MIDISIPKQASFFDLDGTLLKGNSSFHFGKYLYRKKYFSFFNLILLGSIYFFHRLGWVSLTTVHKASFKRIFQGNLSSQVEEYLENFLNEHLDSLTFSQAFQRLQSANEKGHFVAIFSSSPDFIVNKIAQRWNVLHVKASEYFIESQGLFSHLGKIVEGEMKAYHVENFISHFRLDQKSVTVYSDSILDLPFLLSGGNAVVVNPCRKLRALCLQNDWEVICSMDCRINNH